jgi:predicted enzyme related to lactoylglutathione lyase
MASRFTELIVDAIDPPAIAQFWCDVLGWTVSDTGGGAVEIAGAGDGPTIVFVPVPEPKTLKNRLHIDVNATDRTRDEEVERLVALGARRVDVGQGDVSWVVLADPEGNEFCVLQPHNSQIDWAARPGSPGGIGPLAAVLPVRARHARIIGSPGSGGAPRRCGMRGRAAG